MAPEEQKIEEIKKQAMEDLADAFGEEKLEKIRVKYLGRKKGKITEILKSLKSLPLEKRRKIAPLAQQLKLEINKAIDFKIKNLSQKTAGHLQDITLPPKKLKSGRLHPLTETENEVRKIFSALNFSVVDGPEIETEYYNFDALNIPADHPARDMWDTFWLRSNQKTTNSKFKILNKSKIQNPRSQKLLLRTHTSPVQIRYMETHQPPFQIIVPGRVFRYEATDASHETNFYQVEALMVGKDISLSHFKFIIEEFLKKFFVGRKVEFRLRPSYFPFVEPGVEVDVKFLTGSGSKKSEWLELMGAGMVHPRVFEAAHYNPRDWQGFAFGFGLDRLAMLKYKIPDIRMLYAGDLRLVLHQLKAF